MMSLFGDGRVVCFIVDPIEEGLRSFVAGGFVRGGSQLRSRVVVFSGINVLFPFEGGAIFPCSCFSALSKSARRFLFFAILSFSSFSNARGRFGTDAGLLLAPEYA